LLLGLLNPILWLYRIVSIYGEVRDNTGSTTKEQYKADTSYNKADTPSNTETEYISQEKHSSTAQSYKRQKPYQISHCNRLLLSLLNTTWKISSPFSYINASRYDFLNMPITL